MKKPVPPKQNEDLLDKAAAAKELFRMLPKDVPVDFDSLREERLTNIPPEETI